MREERVVGGGPVAEWAGLMQDFWQKVRSGVITAEHFGRFLKKQNPFTDYPEWVEAILTREKRVHQENSVGENADYDLLRVILLKLGKERVERWRQQGREVCLLPPDELTQEHLFFKQKEVVIPPAHFYEWARSGKLYRRDASGGGWLVDDRPLYLGLPETGGTVVLVDTGAKPPYEDGKQMWSKHNGSTDYLEFVVGVVREKGKIARYEYGEQSSRFGVSAVEYEQNVFPVLAREDGFSEEPWRERSERYIEFLYLCQTYPSWPRSKDGKTNTVVWFVEGCEGSDGRLRGGDSAWGGLSDVVHGWADFHWRSGSGRPLAVLS